MRVCGRLQSVEGTGVFMRSVLALIVLIGLVATVPAHGQAERLHVVANTVPPDAFVSLRTDPSTRTGQRVATMPNGTVVKVLEQNPDGWWKVRVVSTGQEGWALSGKNGKSWITGQNQAAPADDVRPACARKWQAHKAATNASQDEFRAFWEKCKAEAGTPENLARNSSPPDARAKAGIEGALRKNLPESGKLTLRSGVIVGDYALQNWNAGPIGGETLLKQDIVKSEWVVLATDGGGLDVNEIIAKGVPEKVAAELKAQLKTAEGQKPSTPSQEALVGAPKQSQTTRVQTTGAVEALTPTQFGFYAVNSGRLVRLPRIGDSRARSDFGMQFGAFAAPEEVIFATGQVSFVIYDRMFAATAPPEVFINVIAKIRNTDSWRTTSRGYRLGLSPHPTNRDIVQATGNFPPGRYGLTIGVDTYSFSISGPNSDPNHCLAFNANYSVLSFCDGRSFGG